MNKSISKAIILLLTVICLTALLLSMASCGNASVTASNPSQKGSDGAIEMSAVTKSGKVDVTVRLKENCGINAMNLTLTYDTDVLTLTGMDEGSALKSLDLMTSNTKTEKGYSITPFKFDYLNANKNDTSTGVMFTLHFSMKKDVSVKQTTVGLRYDSGKITSLTDDGIVAKKFSIYPVLVSLS